MTNPFFEALLDNPEFRQELENLRQWVQDRLFRPGGVVPRNESDHIAWNAPSSTPEYSAIAHSEEEMLNLEKVPGDVIYRADLDQTFLFVGDDSLHPSSYFQVFRLGSQFQASLHETAIRACDEAIASAFGLPPQMLEGLDSSALPSSVLHWQCRERVAPIEPGAGSVSLVPSLIDPTDCKFYSGRMLLRCAVNPCAKTCEGCTDFEPKIQN
jgi:hypothetical protein